MDTKKQIEEGKAVLGIEFGSTRIKAVLIDEEHHPIASGSHEWENQLVDGVWTYSIDAIWNGLQDCYQDMKKDVQEKYGVKVTKLAAIGFSAMMHGYMAFDKDDKILVPFRTWRNAITEEASEKLTDLFRYNIPQRWSVAHLYQAILNGEEHVKDICFQTTLAGYIHWMLTGKKVLGVGDASGKYSVADIMALGVNMAAVMVLIPKMTSLFMEGLMPISEAAKKFTQEKFKGRKFLIGLDAAVVVGNPDVITTSLIVIPLTILMAAVLPGNRVLPFADLAVVTFRVALVVAITRGNLFKNIIMGLVCTGAILLAGTATAPVLTQLATSVGLDLGEGMITSFAATSLTVSFLVYEAFIKKPYIFVPVLIAVMAAVWVFMNRYNKKKTMLAGGNDVAGN